MHLWEYNIAVVGPKNITLKQIIVNNFLDYLMGPLGIHYQRWTADLLINITITPDRWPHFAQNLWSVQVLCCLIEESKAGRQLGVQS